MTRLDVIHSLTWFSKLTVITSCYNIFIIINIYIITTNVSETFTNVYIGIGSQGIKNMINKENQKIPSIPNKRLITVQFFRKS